jgi:hypothetical protein
LKLLCCIVNLIAVCLVVYLGAAQAHASPMHLDHDHGQTVETRVDLAEEVSEQKQSPEAMVHCGSPLIGVVSISDYNRAYGTVRFVRAADATVIATSLVPLPRPPRT